MNDVFGLLAPGARKWVYRQGWIDLRSIQKRAVRPILDADSDIIISAPTAGGKTEAAFLPACSAVAEREYGFSILYISPLKALINDQHRRLETLCDMLEIKVTAWHGDVPESAKKKVRLYPEGILLITPESLESLMILRGGWVRESFCSLRYIIIDEYHTFVGSERGVHVQSLLCRLEHLLGGGAVPRIALSATLGDIRGLGEHLRPDGSLPCLLLEDSDSVGLRLLMSVMGYVVGDSADEECGDADQRIAYDLYRILRGESNLVFANSRKRTEQFALMLRELCEKNLVPNEFFPHHGSLSKELREELESRLHKETLPTTAVCTMTLELGIDIGKVKSIAQITSPHSVSSLRQRLGRSGRRGDPSVLRMFIGEQFLTKDSNVIDKLRLELLQSLAMARLLVGEKWYEPADTELFHFSTLLHQILAVTAQWGGVRARQLWDVLCARGAFRRITVDHFGMLLREMGKKRLITQMSSGELVLGEAGEALVSHYSFYAVFKTPEEFRIVFQGRDLGTLPLHSMVMSGQHIVFGGRRWEIVSIDEQKKVIEVAAAEGGRPPSFSGDGMLVHDRVRREMLGMYEREDYRVGSAGEKKDFIDDTAKALFYEGLGYFRDLELRRRRVIENGTDVCLIPWMGDRIVNTLSVLLVSEGYRANSFAGCVEIKNTDCAEVTASLRRFARQGGPDSTELAALVQNKKTEKYDCLLPESLLEEDYGARAFDVHGAVRWISEADQLGLLGTVMKMRKR